MAPTRKRSTTQNKPARRAARGKESISREDATIETSGGIGQRKEPKSPMPAQHQRKPGLESKLEPRPRYQARHYKGSGKLKGKVALITCAAQLVEVFA